MRFLFPEKFWLLLPWLAVIALWWLFERSARKKLERFATIEALRTLITGPQGKAPLQKARFRRFLVRWLAGALVVTALARPQLGTHTETVPSNGLDVVFVLDVSRSMLTEDVVPSRLQKAKHEIRSFLDRMGGDRVGIVVFAASAYPAVPMTTDFEYVKQTLEGINDKSIPNQGSDLALGLEEGLRLIRGGALNQKGDNTGDDANRLMIVLSDGEDHEGAESKMSAFLKDEGVRIYCVGVGSEHGGPIPLRDDGGVLTGYKKDSSGNMVQSKLESKNLETIASKTGGKYYVASSNEGEIDDIFDNLKGETGGTGAVRQVMVYDELFQIPLGIAVLLLLISGWWGLRPGKWVGAAVLILLLPLSQSVHAASLREYEETKKGLQAYQNKDYGAAVDRFTKAQAASPEADVQHLNLGDAMLQANDLEGATKEFGKLSESKDPSVAARGALNLGKTFEKQNNFEKSVDAYQKGLDRLASAEKPDMEAMMRLKMALEQTEQQKQKQQQQQQQDQQSQNDQQKKDGQSKDDDQKKNNKQNKVNENSTGQKHQFKDEKLSESDAKQLLERLQDQEKKSQQRMMRAKVGRPQDKPNMKDW